MIKAKVIADSIAFGKRMTTFEIEYPRFILAEVNTHRMLSKNSASSRAIPVKAFLDFISENPAIPLYWASNKSGMVAGEKLPPQKGAEALAVWLDALDQMIDHSEKLGEIGVHKQWANRITEPFQIMKTVISGTEWENLFYLRNHLDAQPEFKALAEALFSARLNSTPVVLSCGDWHVPYYKDGFILSGCTVAELDEALKISASCCAQVSYRKSDDSLEKAELVFNRLNVGSETDPCHASPLEHQATPIGYLGFKNPSLWPDGVTSYHKELGYMSGNLAGFIQYRQLVKGHTKW